MEPMDGGAGLGAWVVVLGLGVFHGLNPGMGWLFAVSTGLEARSSTGVFAALPPLAAGHLLAVAAVLLPVSLLALYVAHFTALKLVGGLALIGFGAYKLARPRHPRLLARIGRRHLVLWSFLMATSHGAGLMLVPFVLDIEHSGAGLAASTSHVAHAAYGGMAIAALATLLHTLAMIAAAGAVAWLVYRWLGLRMLQKSWFNLDLLWAGFLIFVGVVALAG
jgi:hypothetical protein